MNLLENESKEENYCSNNSQADSFSSSHSNISEIQDIEPDDDVKEDVNDLEIQGNESQLLTEAWDYVDDEYLIQESSTEQAFERIICVELMNNNKIYVNYQSNWTLRDVKFIFIIFSYKAFR
jgi:hypothetical protein